MSKRNCHIDVDKIEYLNTREVTVNSSMEYYTRLENFKHAIATKHEHSNRTLHIAFANFLYKHNIVFSSYNYPAQYIISLHMLRLVNE